MENQNVIYFDNSTTSLNPESVIKVVNEYLKSVPSSYGRGNNALSITKEIENTRKTVANFINTTINNIIFTARCNV